MGHAIRNEIKIGDFIQISIPSSSSFDIMEGEVTSIHLSSVFIHCTFATDSLAKYMGKEVQIDTKPNHIRRIEKGTSLSLSEITLLIDLALDTQDQSWFLELIERKNRLLM